MSKKIMLITGSSGRIGKVCVHRFAEEFQVVGFDREQADHEKQMDHISMDVSSDESVENALDEVKKRYGNKIASVIHLAAYYSFSGEHPELYDKVTVEGTRRLLKKLQEFEVEQFLFSSTLLVHAPCKLGERINEDSLIEPKWDYPKSKVKTEKIIHETRGKIRTVVMRIAGCYDDQCHSIPIAHNVQRIYEKELEAHFFPGNKKHGNPFLHLEDLGDAIQLAVEKRNQLPEELNLLIGEGKTASYQALQNEISEILRHKAFHVFRIPKWMAKEGAVLEEKLPLKTDDFIKPWMVDLADDHYELDISEAKQAIGWEPKHYVLDELSKMLEQLKTDPLKWYQTNELNPPKWLSKSVAEVKGNKNG